MDMILDIFTGYGVLDKEKKTVSLVFVSSGKRMQKNGGATRTLLSAFTQLEFFCEGLGRV
jgi:hypothetical protein